MQIKREVEPRGASLDITRPRNGVVSCQYRRRKLAEGTVVSVNVLAGRVLRRGSGGRHSGRRREGEALLRATVTVSNP